jgi:hypothetical protein
MFVSVRKCNARFELPESSATWAQNTDDRAPTGHNGHEFDSDP